MYNQSFKRFIHVFMDVLALCLLLFLYPNEVHPLYFPSVGFLDINTAFVCPKTF